MKTILLSLCFFVLCSFNSLFAQEEIGKGMLFPQFEKGVVFFKSGIRSSALLNYNMLLQQMLFQDADSTVKAIANPPEILVIVIGERRFVPISSDGIFYEEIQAGKGSFFVHQKASMLSEGKAAAYGGYSQVSSDVSYGSWQDDKGSLVKLNPGEKFRLSIDHTYYLKSGNSYKRFFSAKALGKLFKSHESEIEEFANKQSINFTRIEDVTRIVEYAYSLQ